MILSNGCHMKFKSYFIVAICIFVNLFQDSVPMCQQIELNNNLSAIFYQSASINISDADLKFIPDIESDKTSSQICPHNVRMCCENRIFEVLSVRLNPVLHKLSGLFDVHENVIRLNIKFKLLYVELIDTMIYHTYLSLNQSSPPDEAATLIGKFYHLFHLELRRKLTDFTRTLDLKSIVAAIFDNKMCFNNSEFISKFSEATDNNFLSFYRHARNLESIILKIQDISLSEDCKNELMKMTLCGICSQSLDWTSYKINISNSNIKICPKYCHTTIRQCMSYYLLLAKQLKVFGEAFLTFINQNIINMDEFSNLWIHRNYRIMTIRQMINISGKDVNRIVKTCPFSSPNEYQDFPDIHDTNATSKFFNCISNNNCMYITNPKKFKKYFTKKIANSKANLRKILITWLNPKMFTETLMGKNCDHLNFSRCWNGFEIGQYHKEIIEFNMDRSDVELAEKIAVFQMHEIKEVVAFIQQSRKELDLGKFEMWNNVPIIEGSGVTHPLNTDDEDFGRNALQRRQSDIRSKYTVTSRQTKQAHGAIVSEGSNLSIFGDALHIKNTLQASFKNTSWIMKISDIILVLLSGASIANYQIL